PTVSPPKSPLFPYTTLFRSLGFANNVRTAASARTVAARARASRAYGLSERNFSITCASVHSCAHVKTGQKRAKSAAHADAHVRIDRKSTRLNSSHVSISYAV